MEPLCLPASHKALFHMKHVGLLRLLFLPNVKHCLKAAPTIDSHIRTIEEALCLPSGGSIFRNKKKKNMKKPNFSVVKKYFETYLEMWFND